VQAPRQAGRYHLRHPRPTVTFTTVVVCAGPFTAAKRSSEHYGRPGTLSG